MPESTDEIDGYIPANLFIRKENFDRWKRLFGEINHLLYQGEDVPALLFEEFFLHMSLKAEVSVDSAIEQANIIANRVLDFFSTREGYDFNYTSAFEDNYIKTYSFRYIILKYIFLYLTEKRRKKSKYSTKEETILFFYTALSLSRLDFTPDHRKQFTKYKIAVVSACLTQEVGFKLTYNSTPAAKDLFQATRHALKGKSRMKK